MSGFVRISVRPLADLPAPLGRRVAVVDRRAEPLEPELGERARLVLRERLRRVEVERARLRLARDRVEHREVEGERLPGRRAGRDDDVLAALRGLPGLGLVAESDGDAGRRRAPRRRAGRGRREAARRARRGRLDAASTRAPRPRAGRPSGRDVGRHEPVSQRALAEKRRERLARRRAAAARRGPSPAARRRRRGSRSAARARRSGRDGEVLVDVDAHEPQPAAVLLRDRLRSGSIALQGRHHGAQKSTITGPATPAPRPRTSRR